MAPIDSVKLVKFVLIDVNSFPDYRLDRIIDERNRIVAPLSALYNFKATSIPQLRIPWIYLTRERLSFVRFFISMFSKSHLILDSLCNKAKVFLFSKRL